MFKSLGKPLDPYTPFDNVMNEGKKIQVNLRSRHAFDLHNENEASFYFYFISP